MRSPLTLLVLSPSTGGYYFGAILTGIAREVASVDGRLILVQTLEPGVRSDEIGEAPDFSIPVAWGEVDGVVSITSAAPTAYLQAVQDAGRPVVVASNLLAGLTAPTARPDNHHGTVAAVEHLIAHGHTRIGFAGNLAQRDIIDRYAAFAQTLAEHGLPIDPTHVLGTGDNAESGGIEAANALLACASRPSALMVATDRNAIGLMATMIAAGVDIPGELAVVGFDNIEASAYTAPALTTVDQPFDEVGALAARLVLAQIRGEDVPAVPHTSPATVVIRGSCGCDLTPPGVEPAGQRALPGQGHRSAADAAALRRECVTHIRRPLMTGREALDGPLRRQIDDLMTQVDALAATDATTARAAVPDLASQVRRLAHGPRTLRHVGGTLTDYVRAVAAPDAADALAAGLWPLRAAGFVDQAGAFELTLDEQFGVDSALLDPDGKDPRDLAWLRRTHVTGGVLALWEGGQEDDPASRTLRISGVHDPGGLLGDLVGTVIDVEQFPPAALVADATAAQRRVCVVVPVRGREHAWGLLAVVTEIETTSARETYHYWAGLLASALEERALQAAVRASERRYAFAARAANDGLWELDPETDGFYVSERGRDLIGLTGPAESEALARAAWEAMIHPEDLALVRAALSAAQARRDELIEIEYRAGSPARGYRWLLCRGLSVGPTDGPVERLVGSFSDIDQRKELEEQLRLGALYDSVTGLPNRRLFLDRLAAAVRQLERHPTSRFAVVFLDLDGFKLVNDSLGHLMGDELLRTVAERLSADLRSVDTAARFGGDEFAVLLVDPIPDEVLVIAQRIQRRIAAPVRLDGQDVFVTASVGITTSESGYGDAEDVLRDADLAMYHSKETERGTASVFDPTMHARATGRLKVRGELRTALAEHQFVVHYQPIVALDGSGVARFEALVRWQHPDRGLLLPGEFLPAMEDNTTIVSLGTWVIDEVCAQLATWRETYPGPVTVAVNLSHREFWSTDLLDVLTLALDRHHVPAHSLVLEITESVIMTDVDHAHRVMAALHDLGIRLHIDDFGTGQSSLHALRTLPVDALKIDGSFIRELTEIDRTAELVGVILTMGRALGLEVIAECVETREQADRLSALGCTDAQGWLYARALSGHDAGTLLGTTLDPAALDPTARIGRPQVRR
ncbi:EAL domain-containing protein [Cellulomonas sp. KRMCY2]|uniref:EAL domain-containing protein n=1 Tax=Cellulomonas sp. KRMCY2 TaxID=1304865 RepID=UPI0004B84925|nr:EAL domain-containing protein [Cellulomonas sp. KRMCY2]